MSFISLNRAMTGCNIVFHCAALTDISRPWEEFFESNVLGTRRVLDAALASGIKKVIHVSSEAAFVQGYGHPLKSVDETTPLPDPDEQGRNNLSYPKSKNLAERVCEEYFPKLDIVIIRPRFIWGYGDTVVLKALIEATKSSFGFSWLGGAECKTSTANISNVVHSMLIASYRGRPGNSYFITDCEDLTFKEMFSRLFETQSIDATQFGNTPMPLARLVAWTGLVPALNATTLALMGQEVTVNCEKARAELEYAPIINISDGMSELREAFAAVK
jgi:nucleoside-diphosphate-sugar epimerase